jgi:hypothetical protein
VPRCELSDAAIICLGQNCHELRELYLTWVTELTDPAVIALARGCPLRILSLHGIKGIGAAAATLCRRSRRGGRTAAGTCLAGPSSRSRFT